jgi:hypothetical protein
MSLPGIETNCLDCVAFDAHSRWLIAGGGASVGRKNRLGSLRELIAWNLPAGDVRWHTVTEAKERISDLAVRPGSGELYTKCTGDISVWSSDGELLRTMKSDFLAGPIVFSPDGQRFIAPKGNVLKILAATTGKVVATVPIASSLFTSAEAAAFVPDTACVVVAASVINIMGRKSGKLLLVDSRRQEVLKSSRIDFDPHRVTVDPRGRWACVAGLRRNRGLVLFWDLLKWRRLAEQGAHGSSLDGVAVSPDGAHLATTGIDHEIRIWGAGSFKTVARLAQHAAESAMRSAVAWSPDGNFIAFACGGEPPAGGVFLYERSADQWRLTEATRIQNAPPAAKGDAGNTRHLRVYGTDVTMDTVGNFNLPANRRSAKCPRCTLPDLDAVPEPYLLSRGFTAPGDFSTAELGNFFVREFARRVLEIAAPSACRFYPTYEAKSGRPTDWFLTVPQTTVQTAKLPDQGVKCRECGEPKTMSHLEPLDFRPPGVDVFKSLQWTCRQIGEEAPWYLEGYLKTPRKELPKEQWTRLGLDRELWISTRLLMLMKQLKVKGPDYASMLENRRPTPAESAWIAEKIDQVNEQLPGRTAGIPSTGEATNWLREYLKQNPASNPLATRQAIAAWEKRHQIKLPKAYVDFATTVGRHTFADMFGMEGYDVRIVGPNDLDAQEYRRDEPEEPGEDAEPDGLMFAVAPNGDCLCFDLRGPEGNYPVYHFNHETKAFEPFADDFACAVRRLAERI